MHDSTKDLLENHPSGAMCPKQYQPSLLSMHKLRQSKSKSVKNRPASSNRRPVTSVGDKRHLRAEESGQFLPLTNLITPGTKSDKIQFFSS